MRVCCLVVGISLSAISLESCQLAKNQLTYDRAAEKDIQDYRSALAPGSLPPEEQAAVPDFQPLVATPADLILPSPLVTVSVNQTVSLRDLMFELAEQAHVDLEMDPQIRGSIIFTAKDRAFNEVIDRICAMSGLRYKFVNGVLRIELDRPFVKDYKIDYMNMTRSSSSSVNNSTSVSSGGGSASGASGSSSSISNSYSADLWADIDKGLSQILKASDTELSLATLADPVSTPIAPPPPPPSDPNNPTPPPLPGNANQPAPTLSVATPAQAPLMPSPPATFTISKETGIVTVFANERQHRMVKKFFDKFHHVSTTQILIEARVLEVSLTDEFATGIDWGTFSIGGIKNLQGKFAFPGLTPISSNVFKAQFDLGKGIRPMVQALSRFGTVRALSSPRVSVMNNQPAIVNMTRNTVYFTVVTTTTPCAPQPCTPTVSQNSTPQSASEGVLMNVLPSANSDTGEIILALRPTVSKITGSAVDPSNAGNKIPEMSVQEIDSIVKLQSGQTVIMGGLMKDESIAQQEGIPVMGDLPILGNLFRNHSDKVTKSELVILLRATIVPGADADNVDRKMYKEFGQDRHPVRF